MSDTSRAPASALTLVIGNKNYASWSLRAWLFLRQHQLPFKEHLIALAHPFTAVKLKELSPSGRVPVLIDGNLRVWDSLAICEYVSERYLGGRGWPSDPQARAVARAVCAQMHADFTCLRRHLPMNLRGEFSWRHVSHAAEADIAQIIALWHACHTAYGQGKPWLFGDFTIADAFFAPVAARFLTYSVPLPPEAARYVDALRSLPAMDAWYAAARNERWRLPQYEALETWLAACPAK